MQKKTFKHTSRSVLSIRSSPKIAETPTDHNRSSQSEVAAHSKGRPTPRELAPNNTSSGHRVANVDTSQHTKRLAKVFRSPFRSPWEVQETTTQCATKNYLVRAFPTRAQQGTGMIKQEDRHEHEGKGQRHRIGICW